MKYFSMFSGIGGFELGIQQAYETLSKTNKSVRGIVADDRRKLLQGPKPSTPTCVGYSEINKYAIQIYEKHFNHKNYGDARKIITKDLSDFDLLVAGFPCQSFSVAGKRRGFNDTRGTLFFEIARVLRDKRPRYFLLENVKGLLSSDKGKTFQTILGVLTDIGYQLEWQVLNSKNFGVPQNRERVFIVGYLGGGSRPKVFPLKEGNRKTLKQIIGGEQANRIYDTDGVSVTIAANAGGQGAKTGLYAMRGREDGQQLEYRGNETNSLTSVQKDNLWIEGARVRRLTPMECERLQGFPDGWTEGISDTQRYKCLGNAVTVNVVEAIMEKLLKLI